MSKGEKRRLEKDVEIETEMNGEEQMRNLLYLWVNTS